MSMYSMQNALREASNYINKRIEDGSKPKITVPHAVHILIVAISAAVIARQINKKAGKNLINEERAFVYGVLHDIGRYIVDENKAGYPHTIAGYDLCMKLNMPLVAQICLTHAVLDTANVQEYPNYTAEQLDFINNKMTVIKRSLYDDLIMLIDLHCRGDKVLPIKERLNKNKLFYNIAAKDYSAKYLDLYSEFTKKYGIDIYQVCDFVATHKNIMFKKFIPYCHGWLRYVCGDNTALHNQLGLSYKIDVLNAYKNFLIQNGRGIR